MTVRPRSGDWCNGNGLQCQMTIIPLSDDYHPQVKRSLLQGQTTAMPRSDDHYAQVRRPLLRPGLMTITPRSDNHYAKVRQPLRQDLMTITPSSDGRYAQVEVGVDRPCSDVIGKVFRYTLRVCVGAHLRKRQQSVAGTRMAAIMVAWAL